MRSYEDYKKEVYENACAYIDANLGYLDADGNFYYDLVNSDSVTGNSSGSYFCNPDKAKEACSGVIFDEDFYNSYQFHFGDSYNSADYLNNISDYLRRGPEIFDVIVRCTALNDVYGDVMDYYEEVMARGDAKSEGN